MYFPPFFLPFQQRIEIKTRTKNPIPKINTFHKSKICFLTKLTKQTNKQTKKNTIFEDHQSTKEERRRKKDSSKEGKKMKEKDESNKKKRRRKKKREKR